MKIKIPKFEEFEDSLNEMAFKNPKTGKPYQEGDVVRVIKVDEWTIENDYSKLPININQQKGVNPDDALFYMRVTKNLTKYIYGEMLFTNCSTSRVLSELRMLGNNVEPPGEEWNYIQLKFNEIKELENKMWLIYGDEGVFMDIKGNKINLKQGNYEYNGYSLNFELTRKFKEPVIGINLQDKKNDKLFYVKLSDIKDISEELTAMEYEAIADWFNENIGMEVKITEEGYFNIKLLWILVDEENDPDFLYKSEKGKENRKTVAGPFINIKQAKQVLEDLKKIKGVTLYDKDKLIIDEKFYGYYPSPEYISVTLDELIAFVNKNGIKVDIKDILDSKSGAIALKNFGF